MATVHIAYNVEEDGNVRSVELPFVLDVLAALRGDPSDPHPLRDRKFTYVDRENLDSVVAAYEPRLHLVIPNRLERHGTPLQVELRFRSLADFEPEGVARQIPAMAKLIATGHAGASEELAEILQAPAFQRLAATWRGLHALLSSVDAGGSVKVRVLDVSKHELLADFREARALERTVLFRKVYVEPFGVWGAEPAAAIVGDYEFSNTADDLELLDSLASLGAAAHAPFVATASPQMFGCQDFAELSNKRGLARIFEGPAYARWRSFRQSGQAAFAVLLVPRMSFTEWGSAAFLLGARLAEAFQRHHWCGAITGTEASGLPDAQEKDLHECGFNVLVPEKSAALPLITCLRPKLYQEAAAAAAARKAAQLAYVLATSRFAHYLMAIMRDTAGQPSRESCEKMLNDWIRQYVVENDSASDDVKAKFPLRDARIKVDRPPDDDLFLATVSLRPHFQVADPGLALRSVVELPPSAA
ncbi:MAG TPA: type VI secretion system contractile sheath small subunit [Bryobacteraceae bacterium]|nr:type VI secretion system contractile sheath small subunit [Bryobacteraceae bacterium]